MNLVFASKAPKQCRPALEKLLFFNPRQYRVREGIINSLEHFGHPRVDGTAEGLTVRVGGHETQTLFAYDRERLHGDPVGVVVFLRTSPEEIAIMHIAVAPNYGLRAPHAGFGLGVVFMEKMKEIAAQIVGVRRIVFFYRREVVFRL